MNIRFTFLKLGILLLFLLPKFVQGQGGTTPAIADNTPVTIPLNVNGTTVGAGNDEDDFTGFQSGNDWFYYFCATTTGVINTTLTFNGAAPAQIFPTIEVYTNLALTSYAFTPGTPAAAAAAYGTQSTVNTANTIGFQLSVTAGTCYYVIIDNTNLNTNGYAYNLTMTYANVTTTPVLQSACTNIGFEDGNHNGWYGNWGHSVINGGLGASTPSYTPVNSSLTQGHHNITSAGTDPFIGISSVCPLIPGNTRSLRLGDGVNGAFGGAELTQKFSVTSANALFTYYYATVMQDAGTDHQNYEQPFFKIEALDCSGNPIVCGNYLVTGGPGIPGFIQVPATTIDYKDWTPVFLDLTPYIGSCITIKFSIGDCSRGAHFAYAYLDASCAPVEIVSPLTACQFNTTTMSAPIGGAAYSWTNLANPSVVIGTNANLTFTPTTVGTFTYQCVVTSVTGCNTTI